MSSASQFTSNKAVLVTGAAKRLGREIALEFARQGWDIAIHYGRSANEAKQTVTDILALGVKALAFQADLSNEVEAKELFTAVAKAFPNLGCIINSASIFEYDRANSDTPLSGKNVLAHMQVNLTAPIILSQMFFEHQKQHFLSQMFFEHQKQHQLEGECIPSVIQLLDQKLINPNPDYLSYTLSKSALLSSIEILAVDFAPLLRVIGLAPGITLPSGDQTAEGFSKAHQMTPLGRSSKAIDVAKAAVFLAESSAITGTTLYVDGGQHLLPSERDVMFNTH